MLYRAERIRVRFFPSNYAGDSNFLKTKRRYALRIGQVMCNQSGFSGPFYVLGAVVNEERSSRVESVFIYHKLKGFRMWFSFSYLMRVKSFDEQGVYSTSDMGVAMPENLIESVFVDSIGVTEQVNRLPAAQFLQEFNPVER